MSIPIFIFSSPGLGYSGSDVYYVGSSGAVSYGGFDVGNSYGPSFRILVALVITAVHIHFVTRNGSTDYTDSDYVAYDSYGWNNCLSGSW